MKTSVIEVHVMLSVLSVDEVERWIRDVPGVEIVTVNFAAGDSGAYTGSFPGHRARISAGQEPHKPGVAFGHHGCDPYHRVFLPQVTACPRASRSIRPSGSRG